MPLYEYECRKCKHRFEKIKKFSDPPEKKCPECGGPVEQVLSAPAVQFKGTGWYVTDYARKSGASGTSAKSDPAPDKSESKSEGKPKSEGSHKKPETKKH